MARAKEASGWPGDAAAASLGKRESPLLDPVRNGVGDGGSHREGDSLREHYRESTGSAIGDG
jgi:hypothetical protein